MKKITEIINEKLKLNNDDQTPATLLEQIELALPELEAEMIDILGKDAVNFDFGLTITEDKNGKFEIESGELIELTGAIGKYTYESFKFNTWGGKVLNNGQVWFNPKFDFKYKGGGSNGTDGFWTGLWFLPEENTWKFGSRTDK